MYSLKKVTFGTLVDIGDVNIFSTTNIPQQILQIQNSILSGGSVTVTGGGTTATINAAAMLYLTNLTEQQATYVNSNTVAVNAFAAINPVTTTVATVYEFDVYINGQYVDKATYTWTPSDIATQTITFNTGVLGYSIDSQDVIIVKGRWK